MIYKDLSPVVERLSAASVASNLNDQAKQVYDSLLENDDSFQLATESSGGIAPGRHQWKSLTAKEVPLAINWYMVDEITQVTVTGLTDAIINLYVPFSNDGDVWVPLADGFLEWITAEPFALIVQRGGDVAVCGVLTRVSENNYTLEISPDNSIPDQPLQYLVANSDFSKFATLVYRGAQNPKFIMRGLDFYSNGASNGNIEWEQILLPYPPGNSLQMTTNEGYPSMVSWPLISCTSSGELTIAVSAVIYSPFQYATFE